MNVSQSRSRPSKYHIDDDGRECSLCHEYRPWAEFHRKNNGVRGHDSRCRTCKNTEVIARRKTGEWGYYEDTDRRCEICGAPIDTPTGGFCQECRTKRQRLAQGNWYLCLRDPSRLKPFLGRQLSKTTLEYSLKDGHIPEGMLFQHIARGKLKGLHVVRGRALSVQWLEAVDV